MELSTLVRHGRKIGLVLQKNSPTLLTSIAVAGLVTTVIMAIKATPKAQYLLEELREDEEEPTKLDMMKILWKPYLPTALMGITTITCIVSANHIHLRRNAALLSLYSLADTTLREYQKKVVETIGKTKEDHIQSAIAQDQLNRHPLEEKTIIVTGKGKHLFYETLSGRYFQSDIEALRKIQNDMNHGLLHNMYFSLNELYFEMGIPENTLGRDIGWEVNHMLEFRFDAKITEGGEPCIVVNYTTQPTILR